MKRLPMLLAVSLSGVAVLVTGGGAKGGQRRLLAASPIAMVKYFATGSLTVPDRLAGGALTSDQLSGAMAADPAGNVYVGVCASDFSHRIVVFDRDGHYVRDFPAGRCGTGEAVKIAVGPDGLVYATRIGPNNEIGVFTREGAQVRLIGFDRYGTITARDIAVDPSGNIYVAIRCEACGTDSDEVVRLSQSGQVTGRWEPLPPPYLCNGQCVKGVAAAPDGTVWVTTSDPNRELVHLDANGKPLADAPHLDVIVPDLKSSAIGEVNFAGGRLYVSGDYRVAVLETSGRVTDVLGTEVMNPGTAISGDALYVTGFTTSPGARAGRATCNSCAIGDLKGKEVEAAAGHIDIDALNPDCHYSTSGTGIPPVLRLPRGTGCNVGLFQQAANNPCPKGTKADPVRATPLKSYVNGKPAGSISRELLPETVEIILFSDTGEVTTGSVVLEWSCYDEATSKETFRYEWKGDIAIIDPSGTVVDRRAGRPVEAATVELQYSVQRAGPFGIPGISGFSPQVNPEVTARDGAFGWNVADGFWRLRATAFGYFPFTSHVYKVPPAVTGLKLKLRPNPSSQRLLIDPYRGRVGVVRVGAHAKRAAGLKLRSQAGRVRGVIVLSKRFRTAAGVKLGSRPEDLVAEYPPASSSLRKKLLAPGGKTAKYRVAHATFTVRRGRVAAIVLG